MYFPPFCLLKQSPNVQFDDTQVTMTKEVFAQLLHCLFRNGSFDQSWYRTTNKDVSAAMEAGHIENEVSHFARSGYFEGRKPRVHPVDEEWYRQAYPDVAEAIASGEIASAHAHYNMTGYFEGRAPDPQTAEMVRQWQQILGPTLNGVSQDVTSPAPEPLGFSRPNSAKTIPRGRAASR